MRKNIFLLVILLLSFNCNKIQDSKLYKNEKIAEERKIINKDKTEIFDDFFKKFSQDSVFQKSRVDFPIKVVELETEELKEDTLTLTSNNYYFQNIKSDSKDYEILKKVSSNKATITLKGIENGIFMDLFFIKKDGKWILKTWNNFSS